MYVIIKEIGNGRIHAYHEIVVAPKTFNDPVMINQINPKITNILFLLSQCDFATSE